MKKVLVILLACFLMACWGLARSDENQEAKTKMIYRGSKYRPSVTIQFVDHHELGKAWYAEIVEYQILGQTRYVGGLEYLTKEQRESENTLVAEFVRWFGNPKTLDQESNLIIITTNVSDVEIDENKSYLVIQLFDIDLDGRPDYHRYGLQTDFDHRTDMLPYGEYITKSDIKLFKSIMKRVDYKKIEKEFQEWLKNEK